MSQTEAQVHSAQVSVIADSGGEPGEAELRHVEGSERVELSLRNPDRVIVLPLSQLATFLVASKAFA